MDNPQLMRFPSEVFPKEIQEIIEDSSSESLYPHNFISAALLFAVAVAIGNSRTLSVSRSWTAKPILFMALLGAPGSSKTHPLNFALRPIIELDHLNNIKYKEELAAWYKNSEGQRGLKPAIKQLRIQDITMESLIKQLESTPHGLCVFNDELKGWISSFDKYHKGGGDRQQWLSLFSGESITQNRKTQDNVYSIMDPYVSVVGGLQPGTLAKTFANEMLDDGFFYRMLFVNDPSTDEPLLWKEPDLPTGCEGKWKNFILKVLDDSGFIEGSDVRKTYHFSTEAWTRMRVWQNSLEILNHNQEAISKTLIFRKIQVYCLRFCIILHTMREMAGEIPESNEIDLGTVTGAISISNYFYEQSQAVHEFVTRGGVTPTRFFELIDRLNDRFTTEEALSVGAMMGLSRSTVFRYLAVEPNDPFIRKLRHGVYEKIK